MAGWDVSEQTIAMMDNLSVQLQELAKQIHGEVSTLEQNFESLQSGLGPHVASIQALIDEIKETEQEADGPVKMLVLKLTKASLVRRKTLENDRYKQLQGKGRSR